MTLDELTRGYEELSLLLADKRREARRLKAETKRLSKEVSKYRRQIRSRHGTRTPKPVQKGSIERYRLKDVVENRVTLPDGNWFILGGRSYKVRAEETVFRLKILPDTAQGFIDILQNNEDVLFVDQTTITVKDLLLSLDLMRSGLKFESVRCFYPSGGCSNKGRYGRSAKLASLWIGREV